MTAAFMGSAAPAEAGSPIQYPGNAPASEPIFRQPDQLPGSKIGVSRAARILLAESTVKIYENYQPSTGIGTASIPQGWCTGIKVRLPDNSTGISIAAHCFEAETGVRNGRLQASTYPQAPALDFFNRAFETYTIDDPLQPVSIRQPLATVDGIAISTRSTDAALLKVAPPVKADPNLVPPLRSYNQLSSFSYSRKTHLIPGQQVGLFGVPGSNNDLPVSSTGIYLGRVNDKEYENGTTATQLLDIVLTHPDQPYNDACYYGSSGSSFVASQTVNGKHSQAAISGPLSMRINSKYDPYLVNNGTATTQKAIIQQALTYDNMKRLQIEHQLRVAINPQDTLCEYTVVQQPTKPVLEGAFGHFAPPLPLKGGGDPNGGMK
jgi:hypothetical protein